MNSTRFVLANLVGLVAAACQPGMNERDSGVDVRPLPPPDAQRANPEVRIMTNPALGRIGEPVAFTAATLGGTPPYTTCTWRFGAGAPEEPGALSGSSCMLAHTFMTAETFAVECAVTDSASRTGRLSIGYVVRAPIVDAGPDARADAARDTGADTSVDAAADAAADAAQDVLADLGDAG